MEFAAEYAKSGRASCRKCKDSIPNQSLRIARMIPSRHHDGKDAHWYHPECFFETQKVATAGLIQNLDALRWDDQTLIRNKCGSNAAPETAAKGGGKKKRGSASKGDVGAVSGSFEDFGVEYAKSGRSNCIACDQKIQNKEVRIWKMDHSSEKVAATRGVPVPRYHHVHCFITVSSQIGFTGTMAQLPGFKELAPEDQKSLEQKLQTQKSEELKRKASDETAAAPPSKVAKTETPSAEKPGATFPDTVDIELMRKQNRVIYALRDLIVKKLEAKELKGADLTTLLEFNGQDNEKGNDAKLERLIDVMVFGALKRCDLCKGQYVFKSGVGYECTGHMSAFTKCADVKLVPEREPFKIPEDLKDKIDGYRFRKVSNRVFDVRNQTNTAEVPKAFVKIKVATLRGWKFFVNSVFTKKSLKNMDDIVTSFGGEIVPSFDPLVVNAVIANESEVRKMPPLFRTIEKHGIPVLKRDFLQLFKKETNMIQHMKDCLLSNWTPVESVPELIAKIEKSVPEGTDGETRKRKRNSLETEGGSVKLKMKDGSVVDPDCPVAAETHVIKSDNLVYSVVLKRTDIDSNLNSYYKLQALESDSSKNKRYYLFRSWGRIGTTVGSSKLDEDLDRDEVIDMFRHHYLDKTGNEFGKPFVMKPGMYMLMDITYEKPAETTDLTVTKKSKLPITVQHLVCLIFDVKRMQSTLMEFEIDTNKMPLGKISREQILKAFSLLDNLCRTLDKPAISNGERLIIDFSNQFFSLIPHNLGMGSVPVLKTKDMVREKLVMLEQLMEIELAYEMIRAPSTSQENVVDDYYQRLNAAIHPLEKNSVDYALIETYLKNTHAATHNQYQLNIQHIYKVDRSGEQDRFEPFSKLPNHQLLWHGSRTTNFAGILSQGLRIAPPEAPVTGYMFGKGIYFADMVSKSANYCYPSSESNSGLLLLCQVALGESKRLTSAKDTLLKAPKGYASVLGVGQTHPDPKVVTMLDKTIKVPYGPPVPSGVRTDLLYNEYIVYDVAQVQLRYILNVEFDFKRK